MNEVGRHLAEDLDKARTTFTSDIEALFSQESRAMTAWSLKLTGRTFVISRRSPYTEMILDHLGASDVGYRLDLRRIKYQIRYEKKLSSII